MLDVVRMGYRHAAGASLTQFPAGALMLTSGAVDSLVSAIWAKTLPLGAAPTPTYGDTTLTVDELDVLAHAVWSKTLP